MIHDVFNGSLTVIRSENGVTVYKRQLNQTALYFVAHFGRILNAGTTRRHALRMFRRYVPTAAILSAIKAYTA